MMEPTQAVHVSRCLTHLLRLRSAFAPFRATVESLGREALETEDRRQLLTLWRPCQRRLDRLLDATAGEAGRGAGLDPLRQEVEDSLRDEVISVAALVELTAAFDQACEALLFRLGEDLRAAVAHEDGQSIG